MAGFSTCLELVAPSRFVWDVNSYYRDLGVASDATRREIREAYQRRNGWKSDRLTYIVSQLLNSKVRAKYDSCPLGALLLDRYVLEWMRLEQVKKATEMYEQGKISQEDWEQSMESLAPEPEVSQEKSPVDENLSESSAKVIRDVEWPWGFYLWGTQCTDRERLREWQELLIEAFSETKEVRVIAVGFSGDMASPWGVQRVGYQLVVFLNEHEQPTEALAREASRVASEWR